MDELKNALPAEGSLACAQKRKLPEESMARYRRNLLLTLGFCLLLADALSWSWGMGNTVTVFAWYLLLALAVGREELFRRRESRVLLGVNLALASTFALTSNPLFRWWNFLALAALVPLHAVSGLGSRPWWDPRMLLERCGLFFQGLFGNLWACFAAAVPEGRKTEKRDGRTMTVVLGLCGAVALVSFLIPVLVSADALFAASLERLNWNFQFRMFHFGDLFQRLFWALAFTPFVFSLLYAMAHPKRLCPAEEKKGLRVDALGFVLALAAVDGLYLAFLAVQSAALFGDRSYLIKAGISYAEYARGGFFQLVGLAGFNGAVILAAVWLCREDKRLRVLSTALVGLTVVRLVSAGWRMTLYVSVYGLSFKRCLTYWGMGMLSVALALIVRKVWRREFRFFRTAAPIALAGWLALNYANIDGIAARYNAWQVERGQLAESAVTALFYTRQGYDGLPALAGSMDGPDAQVLSWAGEMAAEDCGSWTTWSLSAARARRWCS